MAAGHLHTTVKNVFYNSLAISVLKQHENSVIYNSKYEAVLYGIRHYCYLAKATKQTDRPCAFPWILGIEEGKGGGGVRSSETYENVII